MGVLVSRTIPREQETPHYVLALALALVRAHEKKKLVLEISRVRLTKCSVLQLLESGVKSNASATVQKIFRLDRER